MIGFEIDDLESNLPACFDAHPFGNTPEATFPNHGNHFIFQIDSLPELTIGSKIFLFLIYINRIGVHFKWVYFLDFITKLKCLIQFLLHVAYVGVDVFFVVFNF